LVTVDATHLLEVTGKNLFAIQELDAIKVKHIYVQDYFQEDMWLVEENTQILYFHFQTIVV
jgi:hypothetical protein